MTVMNGAEIRSNIYNTLFGNELSLPSANTNYGRCCSMAGRASVDGKTGNAKKTGLAASIHTRFGDFLCRLALPRSVKRRMQNQARDFLLEYQRRSDRGAYARP